MKNAALLMIDFQRDFCDPGGYADLVWGNNWVQPVLPKAQKLLAAAREVGVFIVHTREGYAPDLSDCYDFKRARYRKAGAEPGTLGPLGRVLIRGEFGHDFTDCLKPENDEIIIEKHTFSALCETTLHKILQKNKINILIIAGVTADICVHST